MPLSARLTSAKHVKPCRELIWVCRLPLLAPPIPELRPLPPACQDDPWPLRCDCSSNYRVWIAAPPPCCCSQRLRPALLRLLNVNPPLIQHHKAKVTFKSTNQGGVRITHRSLLCYGRNMTGSQRKRELMRLYSRKDLIISNQSDAMFQLLKLSNVTSTSNSEPSVCFSVCFFVLFSFQLHICKHSASSSMKLFLTSWLARKALKVETSKNKQKAAEMEPWLRKLAFSHLVWPQNPIWLPTQHDNNKYVSIGLLSVTVMTRLQNTQQVLKHFNISLKC